MKSYSIPKQPLAYTCQLFLTQMWGDFRLHVRDFRPSDFYRFRSTFRRILKVAENVGICFYDLWALPRLYISIKTRRQFKRVAIHSLYIRTFFSHKMVQPEICQSIKNILSYSLVIRFLLFNFIESQNWFGIFSWKPN